MEKAALRPQYISFLEKQKQKEGSLLLSGNQLKIIAMITMLIDHIGVNLFPSVTIMRVIGRLSFPIFAYMIAEGCRYTRDRKKLSLYDSGAGNFVPAGVLRSYAVAISGHFDNVYYIDCDDLCH